MDENMNKDDFMNDLYDYLWMPEDEQGALYLHQNILFGRAADEEKIACATLPYLFRLGITPQMRGYEILCRAVILYLLDGIQNSTHLALLMTIAVERGTSLTSVERACAAAVRYAWNEGYMSADDEGARCHHVSRNADGDTVYRPSCSGCPEQTRRRNQALNGQ